MDATGGRAYPYIMTFAVISCFGVVLFLATLRPLARRQETFLVTDEALADRERHTARPTHRSRSRC